MMHHMIHQMHFVCPLFYGKVDYMKYGELIMQKTIYLTGLSCVVLLLNGCQLFQSPENNHRAMCKELKSQIIFNGHNASPSIAFQERADRGKLAQSYHDEGCS